jgi:hypothetical protein
MFSQDQSGSNQAPTNPQSFTTLTGNVLIEAYSYIGSVSDVSVSVGENRIGSPNSPIDKNVRLTIRDGAPAPISLEEIDSTIKGIEYIAKVDKSITDFNGITATYTTKRGLRFEVYYFANKKIMLAGISGGGRASAPMNLNQLEQVRQLIETAKAYVVSHSACLDRCK